jgi:hypothetical protein
MSNGRSNRFRSSRRTRRLRVDTKNHQGRRNHNQVTPVLSHSCARLLFTKSNTRTDGHQSDPKSVLDHRSNPRQTRWSGGALRGLRASKS